MAWWQLIITLWPPATIGDKAQGILLPQCHRCIPSLLQSPLPLPSPKAYREGDDSLSALNYLGGMDASPKLPPKSRLSDGCEPS